MIFKRNGKKIFGVELNSKEQEALDKEIKRQAAEQSIKHAHELEAIVLWSLHEIFGFGESRLRKYYNSFDKEIKDLALRYSMEEESDKIWLCTKKLKDIGIDIEQWSKEINVSEEF